MEHPDTDRPKHPIFLDLPNSDRPMWVKWVDGYRPVKGENTYSVRLLLQSHQLIPPPPPNSDSFITVPPSALKSIVSHVDSDNADTYTARLHVGAIPAIRIGDIYHDKKLKGHLPFAERTFTINTVQTPPRIIRLGDDNDTLKPSGWKGSYRFINRHEYHLPGFLHSHCVMIRDDHQTLLIPCQEVFKTCYAPHSRLAHALTSGVWGVNRNRWINVSETVAISEDHWRVVLRAKTPDDCLPTLAYLSLDPTADAAVRQANSSILRFPPTMEEQFIQANFPFPPSILKFRAKVHLLRADRGHRRYLLTCLSRIDWPFPVRTIDYIRELERGEGGDKEGQIERQGTEHTKGKSPATEIGPGRNEIDGSDGPDPLLEAMDFPLHGFEMKNGPQLIRIPREHVRRHPPRITVPIRPESNPPGSVRDPDVDRGAFGEVDIRLSGEWEMPDRFTALTKALNTLNNARKIDSWEIVEKEKTGPSISQASVWPFGLRRNKNQTVPRQWAAVDRKNVIARTALVLRIVVAGGDFFWLEIECRPNEAGFRCLLFRPRPGCLMKCIQELLGYAFETEGVWGAELASKCPSLASGTARRHSYAREEGGGKIAGVVSADWVERVVREF